MECAGCLFAEKARVENFSDHCEEGLFKEQAAHQTATKAADGRLLYLLLLSLRAGLN